MRIPLADIAEIYRDKDYRMRIRLLGGAEIRVVTDDTLWDIELRKIDAWKDDSDYDLYLTIG